jgi:hypothetical protein
MNLRNVYSQLRETPGKWFLKGPEIRLKSRSQHPHCPLSVLVAKHGGKRNCYFTAAKTGSEVLGLRLYTAKKIMRAADYRLASLKKFPNLLRIRRALLRACKLKEA